MPRRGTCREVAGRCSPRTQPLTSPGDERPGAWDTGCEGRLCDKCGTFDITKGITDSVQWHLLSTCCEQVSCWGGASPGKIRSRSSLALRQLCLRSELCRRQTNSRDVFPQSWRLPVRGTAWAGPVSPEATLCRVDAVPPRPHKVVLPCVCAPPSLPRRPPSRPGHAHPEGLHFL